MQVVDEGIGCRSSKFERLKIILRSLSTTRAYDAYETRFAPSDPYYGTIAFAHAERAPGARAAPRKQWA